MGNLMGQYEELFGFVWEASPKNRLYGFTETERDQEKFEGERKSGGRKEGVLGLDKDPGKRELNVWHPELSRTKMKVSWVRNGGEVVKAWQRLNSMQSREKFFSLNLLGPAGEF